MFGPEIVQLIRLPPLDPRGGSLPLAVGMYGAVNYDWGGKLVEVRFPVGTIILGEEHYRRVKTDELLGLLALRT